MLSEDLRLYVYSLAVQLSMNRCACTVVTSMRLVEKCASAELKKFLRIVHAPLMYNLVFVLKKSEVVALAYKAQFNPESVVIEFDLLRDKARSAEKVICALLKEHLWIWWFSLPDQVVLHILRGCVDWYAAVFMKTFCQTWPVLMGLPRLRDDLMSLASINWLPHVAAFVRIMRGNMLGYMDVNFPHVRELL